MSRKRAFPDERTLHRVRDKLSDVSYSGGNLALPAMRPRWNAPNTNSAN